MKGKNWWDAYSYDETKLQYVIPNYKIERFKNEVGDLRKELETTKKLLEDSVKLISKMEEYLGRFGMKNSIESTSLFHVDMVEFLAKLSKEGG